MNKGDMVFTVYGRENCTFCTKAKTHLEVRGYRYEYVDLDRTENLEILQRLRATGARSVPQIYIANRHIGGYTDLVKFTSDLEEGTDND